MSAGWRPREPELADRTPGGLTALLPRYYASSAHAGIHGVCRPAIAVAAMRAAASPGRRPCTTRCSAIASTAGVIDSTNLSQSRQKMTALAGVKDPLSLRD